ncbi:MAG: adenylate/guanylate cyclase domain-containing protein [Synergistaceae bacterium]
MGITISKTEYEAVFNAIEKSLSTKVEEIELSDKIPTLDDTQDNNKVFRGKLSVLFVDMRKSTDLTDDLKSKKMVKIYRSFIRMIIQAIRYSGGETRQFAGDGIMGVFQDDVDSDDKIKSSEKAIKAARYIITMMDYCLNPLLSKNMDGLSIACGVGICTGTVLVTKVGMRGKEQDNTSENEMGLVWTGKTTNYASRYCGLANSCEIFIDNKTFAELNDKSVWNECSRVKGNKAFKGFISHEYYLVLDGEISSEPVKAINTNTGVSFVQEIFEDTKEQSLLLIDEISKKSMELSKRLEEVKKREAECQQKEHNLSSKETQLKNKENQLLSKQNELNEQEIKLHEDEYRLHENLFSDTYCKDDIIKSSGKDFWLKEINLMFELGSKIGKSTIDVKSDLDCYLVKIYLCFDMEYEAYDALCIQAEYGSWLNEYVSVSVVTRAKYYTSVHNRFRSILEKRRWTNDDCNKVLQKLNELRIGL